MPNSIGGVDISTKALHFGVVDGSRLIDAWADPLGFDLPNRLVTMAKAMRRMKDHGVQVLWLEAPWFRAGAGSTIHTLELHRTMAHLEAVLVGNGMEVQRVPIASWRMVVLGNGRPKDPKAESLWYVDAAFKYKTKDHNQADAICLAAYGAALARSRVPNATTSSGRRR